MLDSGYCLLSTAYCLLTTVSVVQQREIIISILTILWSMAAATCLTIGSFSFIIWMRQKETRAFFFFSIAALSAAFFAMIDLHYYRGDTIADLIEALRWTNVGVYGLLIGLVWFLYYYFRSARLWLAWAITAVWSFLLIINFVSTNTMIFDQVSGIEKIYLPWGEEFNRLSGSRNIWSHVADAMSLVILIYFADASLRLWKKEQKKQVLLVGGSVIFFMVAAGIHTPLVDMGLVSTPYLLAFAFMFIVVAMGIEISYSVIRSSQLSREVIANERRWRSLLENVQLLVIELDKNSQIQYSNPYFLDKTGYAQGEILGKDWFKNFIPAHEHNELAKVHHQVIEEQQHPHFQNTLILKNGEERLINWTNVPLYDSEGKPGGAINIGTDVTEERNATKEIEKLKDRLQEENIFLREELIPDHQHRDIIGKSDVLKYALTRVGQVAQTEMTVLIEGETGVGKELFARAIHHASSRKEQALIKVNCAAIPPTLIESELFGHEQGAFTGANKLRKGRFEMANGGTVFLDEIGEIPVEIQTKLLHVLEEGEFERVGGNKIIKVDVRIIAATNRKLKAEVSAGRFREDLFFRLNAYPISIPPLRQRIEDIPLLVEKFVDIFSRKVGKRILKISKDTINMLNNYDWPGNVRELRNVIERAVLSTDGDKLKMTENLVPIKNPEKNDENLSSMALEEVEKEYILKVLEQCDWRINGDKGAAKILKLHPNTLRNRMIKLDIIRNNAK